MTQRRYEIRKEAERIHESALCASETQFEYAKRWRRVDRWLATISAVLAAVAGAGGLSAVLSGRWAGFVAILAAGAAAVAASIGAPQTKAKAARAANAYRTLQQDARVFLSIDLGTYQCDDDARARLQELIVRLQELNQEADIPSTGSWRRAKKQIDAGSQQYEADAK
ncbi:MAG: SLATT domain-containing protein [Actinobacteria bacterium]|nr:SLATT domain-containing protein [Actinomycetota bacterium]